MIVEDAIFFVVLDDGSISGSVIDSIFFRLSLSRSLFSSDLLTAVRLECSVQKTSVSANSMYQR